MDLGFSVRQLAQATKLPTRLLQFWTDRDVLRPILATASAGRGVHRLYPASEVEIAKVLAKIVVFQPRIQVIEQMAVALRDVFQIPDDFEFASLEEAERFLRAHPQGKNFREVNGVPVGTALRKVPRAKVTAKKWRDEYTGLERRNILAWIAIQRARRNDGFAFLVVLADSNRIAAIVNWAPISTEIKLPQMGRWGSYLLVDLGEMTKVTVGSDLPIDEIRAEMKRKQT